MNKKERISLLIIISMGINLVCGCVLICFILTTKMKLVVGLVWGITELITLFFIYANLFWTKTMSIYKSEIGYNAFVDGLIGIAGFAVGAYSAYRYWLRDGGPFAIVDLVLFGMSTIVFLGWISGFHKDRQYKILTEKEIEDAEISRIESESKMEEARIDSDYENDVLAELTSRFC